MQQRDGAVGETGLSEAEAARRLAEQGPNELPADRRRAGWALALDVIREPMFLLLVGAGSLYLLMGETRDALMLLACVFVVIGITFLQERRTERALESLRQIASPRALVIREGVARRILSRELVVGDLMVVSEGDRVPADAHVRQSSHLAVDESLLTGESVPVDKRPGASWQVRGDPVYSGTLVTAGSAVCEVLATGASTEFGKLGRSLDSVTREASPLQRETGAAVRALAAAGLVACVLVAIAYGLTRGGSAEAWREGGLAGIAMAMSMLPEEFPVVLTVFLALGAWRLGRRRVLTRRLPAIETLGAATVLCVDKTGTLTCNEMRLAAVSVRGRATAWPMPAGEAGDAVRELLRVAVRASRADPFDPMERALHAAARGIDVAGPDGVLLREYPLAVGRSAVVHVWQHGEACEASCKGAPEAVGRLCGLAEGDLEALAAEVTGLASRGLRVLGVAVAPARAALPEDPGALSFGFLGLVAFADPVRPEVPQAVAECRAAGIRVVMVTGDYPATALAIARDAGIDASEGVLTGADLESMDDGSLEERIGRACVFARIAPQQKLRLVRALQGCGEVVAMTGDGVNDAPALRAAHIGVAMGARGTDVAREAADLVLVDDSFASIAAAVRLGRRIYDNIRKATAFILAVHVPIAGLSMLPALLPGWPLLLLPVHIVFLELVIDPTCSLVFEAEHAETDVMRRPPRDRAQRLFSRHTVSVAVMQGLSMFAACLAVFLLARDAHGPDAARALTFAALVVSILALILVNRTWEPTTRRSLTERNRPFWAVSAGALGLLGLALWLPPARDLFSFAPLHPGDLMLALAAGLACLVWFEAIKRSRWWRAARLSA